MLKRRNFLLSGFAAFVPFSTFQPIGPGGAPTVTGVSVAGGPATGPIAGGTTITVTGTGFVIGSTTVKVGGNPATSVSVSSSTTLTCVTPSASVGGAVSVNATVAGLPSADNTFFTYTTAVGQIASIALSSFTNLNPNSDGGGNADANSDGTTTGWKATVWANMTYWFNFPTSDYYQFVIPAYCVGAPAGAGNSLLLYIDQVQVQTARGSQANGNWFCEFVTNIGTAGAGPSVNYNFGNVSTAGGLPVGHPVIAGWHSITVQFMSAGYYPSTAGATNTTVHLDRLNIIDTGVPIPAEPAGSRDPFKFPLSSYHFFNTPFGANVTWSSGTPADATLQGAHLYMNLVGNSSNAFEGTSNSLPWIVSSSDSTVIPTPSISLQYPVRAPPGSFFSGGSDNAMLLVDGTNPRYFYNGFGATYPSANTAHYYRMTVVDNYSQAQACGQSGWGGAFPGTITQQDIESGAIQHRLNMGMNFGASGTYNSPNTGPCGSPGFGSVGGSFNQTSNLSGLPWPACESDADFRHEYVNPGGIPYGSVIGIPANVAMPAGAPWNTTGGAMFWNCLQRYGMFYNVSAGNAQDTHYMTIFVAGGMKQASGAILNQIQGAFSAIIPYLRIVTNPQPIVPGQGFGGGSFVAGASLLPGLQTPTLNGSPSTLAATSLGLPPYAVPSTPARTLIMGSSPGQSSAAGGAISGPWQVAIPRLSFVVVGLLTQGYNTTWPATISDSAGNSYTVIQPTANSSNPQIGLAYCLSTNNAIATNTTWTAAASPSSYWFTTGVFYIPAVGSPAFHASSTTTGNGTGFSIAAAGATGDLAIGMGEAGGIAFSPPSGYGVLTEASGFSPLTANGFWFMGYQQVGSTGTVTYAPSWSADQTNPYKGILATFSGLP